MDQADGARRRRSRAAPRPRALRGRPPRAARRPGWPGRWSPRPVARLASSTSQSASRSTRRGARGRCRSRVSARRPPRARSAARRRGRPASPPASYGQRPVRAAARRTPPGRRAAPPACRSRSAAIGRQLGGVGQDQARSRAGRWSAAARRSAAPPTSPPPRHGRPARGARGRRRARRSRAAGARVPRALAKPSAGRNSLAGRSVACSRRRRLPWVMGSNARSDSSSSPKSSSRSGSRGAGRPDVDDPAPVRELADAAHLDDRLIAAGDQSGEQRTLVDRSPTRSSSEPGPQLCSRRSVRCTSASRGATTTRSRVPPASSASTCEPFRRLVVLGEGPFERQRGALGRHADMTGGQPGRRGRRPADAPPRPCAPRPPAARRP